MNVSDEGREAAAQLIKRELARSPRDLLGKFSATAPLRKGFDRTDALRRACVAFTQVAHDAGIRPAELAESAGKRAYSGAGDDSLLAIRKAWQRPIRLDSEAGLAKMHGLALRKRVRGMRLDAGSDIDLDDITESRNSSWSYSIADTGGSLPTSSNQGAPGKPEVDQTLAAIRRDLSRPAKHWP